jgi:hypothetical protein
VPLPYTRDEGIYSGTHTHTCLFLYFCWPGKKDSRADFPFRTRLWQNFICNPNVYELEISLPVFLSFPANSNANSFANFLRNFTEKFAKNEAFRICLSQNIEFSCVSGVFFFL